MTLTTPVKAASGLALTSVGVAGSAVAYKYATDFYSIEKVAASKGTALTIVDFTESEDKKSVTATFSVNAEAKHEKDFGIKSGTWTCKLTISPTTTDGLDNKKTIIKTEMNNYFNNFSTTPTTATIKEENRDKFVSSCSKNRGENPKPTYETVSSELKISLSDITADSIKDPLKRVFVLGDWVNSK